MSPLKITSGDAVCFLLDIYIFVKNKKDVEKGTKHVWTQAVEPLLHRIIYY